MAIQDDFSVASNGDIRHVSGTTVYSVNAFHAWLQDLADDASPSGNDLISILSDDPSSIEGGRATDKPRALNLLGSFNIDDDAAKHINFGSVAQASARLVNSAARRSRSAATAAASCAECATQMSCSAF